MKKTLIFHCALIFIFNSCPQLLYAGRPGIENENKKQDRDAFIENKGQLAFPDVKYYRNRCDMQVYCKPGYALCRNGRVEGHLYWRFYGYRIICNTWGYLSLDK